MHEKTPRCSQRIEGASKCKLRRSRSTLDFTLHIRIQSLKWWRKRSRNDIDLRNKSTYAHFYFSPYTNMLKHSVWKSTKKVSFSELVVSSMQYLPPFLARKFIHLKRKYLKLKLKWDIFGDFRTLWLGDHGDANLEEGSPSRARSKPHDSKNNSYVA